MTEERGKSPDIAIERGETYGHETHGQVEVLGIWRGIERVDEAGNPSEAKGPIVVCYSIQGGDQPIGELSDTLDSFLTAIESID